MQHEMCRAAAEGCLEKLSHFLDCGVTPNSLDYGQRSALHLASANGHIEIVKYLLSKGADVFLVDRLGRTAIDDARHAGHKTIMTIIEAAMSDHKCRFDTEPQISTKVDFFADDRLDISGILCRSTTDLLGSADNKLPSSLCSGKQNRKRKPTSSPIFDPPSARDIPALLCTTNKQHRDSTSHDDGLSQATARATVVCIDIKGFTERCAAISAGAAGAWVADFYARVDGAAAECGVRRVESRGDCCICVASDEDGHDSTWPQQGSTQARRALAFATVLNAELSEKCGSCSRSSSGGGGAASWESEHDCSAENGGLGPISARMGIATGAVVFLAGAGGGFAGVHGEAVDAATRMEALSQPGVAVVHETTAEQWAAETGGRTPRTACCRAARAGQHRVAGDQRSGGGFTRQFPFVARRGARFTKPERGPSAFFQER